MNQPENLALARRAITFIGRHNKAGLICPALIYIQSWFSFCLPAPLGHFGFLTAYGPGVLR